MDVAALASVSGCHRGHGPVASTPFSPLAALWALVNQVHLGLRDPRTAFLVAQEVPTEPQVPPEKQELREVLMSPACPQRLVLLGRSSVSGWTQDK